MNNMNNMPEDMNKAAEDFANAVLKRGKGFAFVRFLGDGTTRSGIVMFMDDAHPVSPVIHAAIKYACSEEVAKDPDAIGVNMDKTLASLKLP